MSFPSFDPARYYEDRAAFRREQILLPNGRAYGECEESWQRERIWKPWDSGRFHIVYEELSRGHAKTTMAAMAALEWALFEEQSEIAFFAGDADQAGIALKIMTGMIRANPALASSFRIQRDRVEVPATGTVVQVMASDAATAFGIGGSARSLLVVVDEFWVWTAELLWEAVISSTGKVGDAWRVLILSNAGIEGESKIAWRIREEARKGEDPTMYFWRSAGAIAGWITDAWKAQQRRLLTPGGYTRLIDNEWTAGESQAVSPAEWDALTSSEMGPYPAPSRDVIHVGVDASKSARKGADTTAAVAVRREGEHIRLVAHRIWKPAGSEGDVDLRATVLPWLVDLQRRCGHVRAFYDPYNLSTLAQIGREAGLRLVELPQNQSNQTRFTGTFMDTIRSQALRVYEAPDLREHVLNAVMVESVRGIRLAKEKTFRKIDGAVALAMACDAALSDFPAGEGPATHSESKLSVWSDVHESFSTPGNGSGSLWREEYDTAIF